MRALVCHAYGEASNLVVGDLPTPKPEAGQVQVQVARAGTAYVDALMVRDKHQNKHALPFAPGLAFAGTVSALGDGVQSVTVGQRVMGLSYDGALAETAVAPALEVFPLPDAVSFDVGATLASAYLTPHAALRWEADLQPGERLLVLGASGTVGSAAVAVGKAYGATVIAAASTPHKVATATSLGADHGICYGDGEVHELVAATGDKNVDVIFDPVGGPLFESTFKTLDWGGRYIVVGFAGGSIPQFAGNRLLVKNRKAIGFVLMYYRRKRTDLLAKTATELCALVTDGKLAATPQQVVPHGNAGAAIDDFFYRRASGITVIEV